MNKLIKLDNYFKMNIVCPICYQKMKWQVGKATCKICSSIYKCKNGIWDFRINPPDYAQTFNFRHWHAVQQEYESFSKKVREKDNHNSYLEEINGVAQIYTKEFHLTGSILDVGGNCGLLRQFLTHSENYVSIDPYLSSFENIGPNRVSAYPCLKTPCNFLASFAEYMPFADHTFDWIHIRSVLDHVYDPYMVMKQTYRILKDNGRVLIGINTEPKNFNFLMNSYKIEGIERTKLLIQLLKDILRLKPSTSINIKQDDHTFEWAYSSLLQLFKDTRFDIEKTYWQKSCPTCVYISLKKILQS